MAMLDVTRRIPWKVRMRLVCVDRSHIFNEEIRPMPLDPLVRLTRERCVEEA